MSISTTSFFSRKYPYSCLSVRASIIIGLSVSLIVFVFKPFGFHSYPGNQVLAALGFGLITFLSVIISNQLVKNHLLLKVFSRWTIMTEIVHAVFTLSLISVFNHFLLVFMHGLSEADWLFFLYSVMITIAVGVFPITGVVLFRYHNTLKTNLAKIINDQKGKVGEKRTVLLNFTSVNKSQDDLRLPIDQFICAESIKNVVHVFYEEEGILKECELRNTLSQLYTSLDHPYIFRCHRSFFINTNRIKTAKGNSNGYKLLMKGLDRELPVSRSYTPDFQRLMFN